MFRLQGRVLEHDDNSLTNERHDTSAVRSRSSQFTTYCTYALHSRRDPKNSTNTKYRKHFTQQHVITVYTSSNDRTLGIFIRYVVLLRNCFKENLG